MQDYNRKGAFFEMNEKAFAPIKVFEPQIGYPYTNNYDYITVNRK